jgi:hypothetical protein
MNYLDGLCRAPFGLSMDTNIGCEQIPLTGDVLSCCVPLTYKMPLTSSQGSPDSCRSLSQEERWAVKKAHYYKWLQKSKLRVKFRPKGGGGALGHGHRVD